MKHRAVAIVLLVMGLFAAGAQAQQQPLIPLQVELLSRAVSKMPLMIAYDQGLYKKHGLDVKLWLPEAEYPGGIETAKEQPKRPDISVDGGTPMMVSIATDAAYPHRVILASTDCNVRWHIIGQKGLKSVDELKGKRLGVSGVGAMTSFIALLFAERMGWDPVKDISIMSKAWRPVDLQNGLVDAFVADERYFATAKQAGYPILADTSEWKATIAGNSVRVMMKWHGMDRETASVIYTQGMSLERKPYPCYDGIKKTMQLFDSNEMRKYKPQDFYDDSLLKEIDQSGFIDKLYQ